MEKRNIIAMHRQRVRLCTMAPTQVALTGKYPLAYDWTW